MREIFDDNRSNYSENFNTLQRNLANISGIA
jgi:hypothetical protein